MWWVKFPLSFNKTKRCRHYTYTWFSQEVEYLFWVPRKTYIFVYTLFSRSKADITCMLWGWGPHDSPLGVPGQKIKSKIEWLVYYYFTMNDMYSRLQYDVDHASFDWFKLPAPSIGSSFNRGKTKCLRRKNRWTTTRTHTTPFFTPVWAWHGDLLRPFIKITRSMLSTWSISCIVGPCVTFSEKQQSIFFLLRALGEIWRCR